MGTWRLVADIAGPMAAGALLVVLAWAATERGRMHHVVALHRGLTKDAAALLARRFGRAGLFRLPRPGRHAWRPTWRRAAS